eukprot:UN31828
MGTVDDHFRTHKLDLNCCGSYTSETYVHRDSSYPTSEPTTERNNDDSEKLDTNNDAGERDGSQKNNCDYSYNMSVHCVYFMVYIMVLLLS